MKALFNENRSIDESDMEFGEEVDETGILRHKELSDGTPLPMLMTNVFQKISRVFSSPLPKILLSNGLLESYRAY